MLIVTIMCGLMFLTLFYFSFHLFGQIGENKVIENSFHKLYGMAKEQSLQRVEKEKRIRLEEGRQEKISFFYKMDLMLEQSGMLKIFPRMNTEIYVAISISFSILSGIACNIVFHEYLIGLFTTILSTILFYLILYILSEKSNHQIQQNIIPFINLMENYSKTSDDIVEIFTKMYGYLEEPLRSLIEDFTCEANNTGDLRKSFSNLENRIGHVKLKEVIRNIEICSRHEANYEEIIKDSRSCIRDYLSSKEEQNAIRNTGRLEIVIMLVCCGAIVSVFSGFTQNFAILFFSGLIGNVILGYCVFVVILCLWFFITIQ